MLAVCCSVADWLTLRCLQMLVDLGLSVYAEDFEKPFLTATAEFYMVCCLARL